MAKRRRTLVLGGIAGAVAGMLVAPRDGETRRAAAQRLRLALRSGRGSVAAFGGTPCATTSRTLDAHSAPEVRAGSAPPDVRLTGSAGGEGEA